LVFSGSGVAPNARYLVCGCWDVACDGISPCSFATLNLPRVVLIGLLNSCQFGAISSMRYKSCGVFLAVATVLRSVFGALAPLAGQPMWKSDCHDRNVYLVRISYSISILFGGWLEQSIGVRTEHRLPQQCLRIYCLGYVKWCPDRACHKRLGLSWST